jgi:preprotein translocase subunit Sec63
MCFFGGQIIIAFVLWYLPFLVLWFNYEEHVTGEMESREHLEQAQKIEQAKRNPFFDVSDKNKRVSYRSIWRKKIIVCRPVFPTLACY